MIKEGQVIELVRGLHLRHVGHEIQIATASHCISLNAIALQELILALGIIPPAIEIFDLTEEENGEHPAIHDYGRVVKSK